MKTNAHKIFAIAAIWMFATFSWAQAPVDFFKSVGDGNYAAVASAMAEDVDVTILDDVQFVSGQQAANLLKNFVQGIGLKKIEALHNGSSSKNVSAYKLAKLTSAQGSYKLFVYTESSGGKSWVKEIRVEKF
ncbi:MAG: DUF4783 domain-containing protein [Saprospiraceae bacterium]|nr:DUF4783 domain-containing protein [Saprospiraceae bacterium]